jgi:hypothetical protein
MPADRHECEIDALAKKWARRLCAYQYAGELVIAEDDLPALAGTIRRDLFSARRSRRTATCMFVLAVNCMYYHHDEQGFWVHFCRLMDVPNTPQHQSWMGESLETQLLEFRFLAAPGFGPFRYVTPIREQCGITRTEIPRFADLLSWLTGRYGWDGIRVLDQAQIAALASNRFPIGHLTSFLTGEQGYAFVRDVARNVSQFQRRILTMQELTTLTGYRTGFFAELFEAIGRAPPPSTDNVSRPPLPRLLFLPEFRQVGLSFDPGAVMRGAFRLKSKVVRQTPYLCASREDYSSSVTGERRDSDGKWSNWSIPGWNPQQCPVALLHVDRGFIDHRVSVPPPGDYFLLGPYNAPPPAEVCAGDYGMVDLPFPDLELDVWRIVITVSTDLAFLGLARPADLVSIDLIAWSDTRSRITGTLESAMAFPGALPALTIRRTELFTSNAVALFIDDGKESRRVHVEPGATSVHLDVAAPSQGRVWVEPISRLREFAGRDTLCEIHYCLLPECDIQWPHSLYPLDEQPEITLSTQATNLSMELDNATPIDSDKRQWRAAARTTVLQGNLRTTRFVIPIAQRIHRATLREQHKPIAAHMLAEQTQRSGAWILSGVPRESADLAITDGITDLPLGTLGDFNAAGECRFPGTAIRDALAHWGSPVGMLAVCRAGQAVPTGTRYVDCAALIEWLSTAYTTDSPAWLNMLDAPLRNLVEQARLVRDAPQGVVPSPEGVATIPEELQTFFTTVRACSAVFDDSLLPENPEIPPAQIAEAHAAVSVATSALLLWYLKANAFVQAPPRAGNSTAEALCAEYKKMTWLPPFPRWCKAIDDVLALIKSDDELIQEWKRDVEGGFRLSYPSRIANQKGGHELTEAWIKYYKHANYQPSINNVYHLIQQTGNPVAEIAAILLMVCYMRKGVFDFPPPQLVVPSNCTLSAVCEEIMNLAMMGAKSVSFTRPALTELAKILPALPLRQEDATMITAVRSRSVADNNSRDSDWLTCYYLCLLYESGMAKEEPMATREMVRMVPASSPVKPRIIETLERHLHD